MPLILIFFLPMAEFLKDRQNFTLHIIRIIQYIPTLRHIATTAVCTRTLVLCGDLWRSVQSRHTCTALITLLLISLTPEGWKAGSNVSLPEFERWKQAYIWSFHGPLKSVLHCRSEYLLRKYSNNNYYPLQVTTVSSAA